MDWDDLWADFVDILNAVSLISVTFGAGFLCLASLDYAGVYELTGKSYKHLLEPGLIMAGIGIGLNLLSFFLDDEEEEE